MGEIRGFFPVNRKRKVLGTIPVTLNLKEGTMKVREDKMELKPIEEMSGDEILLELADRLKLKNAQSISRGALEYFRENDIGTENLKTSEPEWKMERIWPHEKPIDYSWVFCNGQRMMFFPKRGRGGQLVGECGSLIATCDHGYSWRYLTEPLTWKNVERDGNPSEAGWYEIPPNGPYRRFRYWEGKFWNLHMGGEMCGDPTDYCPIAPAPKFEEAE